MVDFYIPSKTDKSGGKFGFVRYKKPHSLSGLLKNLDDIWISSYKIRVKLVRFDRGDPKSSVPNQNSRRNIVLPYNPGWIREKVSFAEAVS